MKDKVETMLTTASCEPRQSSTPSMIPVRPMCRDEEEFIRGFANALNHATAVVAADPAAPMPCGSIAERVRKAYVGFRPELHPAIQRRARARLSGSTDERRRLFGAYADRGANASALGGPALDPDLRKQLRQAVRARLDAQRGAIENFLADHSTAKPSRAAWPLAKTWLEAGYFSGDIQASWKTLTISYPISVQFRWKTQEMDAETGRWGLYRAGHGGQPDVWLASGPAGDAPGGIFKIDLRTYLASTPPDVPATYKIRVTPSTKGKRGVPGSSNGPVPAKPVGLPSDPIVITYSAIGPPRVHLDVFEIYRDLTFTLDSIHMVEDQIGPGAEEFHIAGFVQESLPSGSNQVGQQEKFGPYFARLHPDGPRTKVLGHSSSFHLNNPDMPEWPRVYTLIASIVEEDDGGSLAEWQSKVWEMADDMVASDIADDVSEYLQENFDELIAQLPNLAQYVASLTGPAVNAIVGTVIAVATLIISDIVGGMGDDYYGTEVFTLILPTSITDFVHSLPGHITAGGDFECDTETLMFRGHTSFPEAASFDGIVNLNFHWTLRHKEMF